MVSKDLILNDIAKKYDTQEIQDIYLQIYADVEPRLKIALAYFHQELNRLLDYMNQRSRSGGHYTANESRELWYLIDEIRKTKGGLARAGMPVTLDVHYEQVMSNVLKFLELTGGSGIPEGFEFSNIEQYGPIFRLEDSQVAVRNDMDRYPLKNVGEGSFARVYKYKDKHYNMFVALKRAKPNMDERDLYRFQHEYSLIKELDFPYIVKVYSYDDEKKQYTMEYCDTNLRDYIDHRNTKLSNHVRKRIALQFLYGLNYLHLKGILHRDLSYKNILVQTHDLGAVTVKLSDFGLAKSPNSDFTKTGSELKGTIVEHTLSSFDEYEKYNEIYAVGFILAFIFTGKMGTSGCKGSLKDIVDKCIVADRGLRYASVAEIIKDVESMPFDFDMPGDARTAQP